MKLLDRVLRIFSVGFLMILCLFFLGIGLLTYVSGVHNLQFSLLPWSGPEATRWITGLSLFGLFSMAVSGRGKLSWLFAIFATYVFYRMIWGFYLGPHRFEGLDDFRQSFSTTGMGFTSMMGAIRTAWTKTFPK